MSQPWRQSGRIGHLTIVVAIFLAGCGGRGDDQTASRGPAAHAPTSVTATPDGQSASPTDQLKTGPPVDGRSHDAGNEVSTAPESADESPGLTKSATPKPAAPASVREATAAIDLRGFPRMAGGQDVHAQASLLVYDVPAEIPQAARFHVEELKKLGWQEDTEITPPRVDEESALLGFRREGFYLSLSIDRLTEKEGFLQITLRNQGNVDTRLLPRYADADLLYGGQATAIYLTPATVDGVVQFTRNKLASLGWQEYEPPYRPIPADAGNVGLNFRQNGVALSVYIRPAPNQDDQTSVQYDTSVLNSELPLPPGAEAVEFDDVHPSLKFQITSEIAPILQFYRGKAEELGWTAKDDLTDVRDTSTTLFFEGSGKELYMLSVSKNDEDKAKVTLEGVLTQPDGA